MNRLFEESLSRARPHEPGAVPAGWSPLADVFETAEMLGDQVRGTCHSFQPEMMVQAVRVKGQTRDFTDEADALLGQGRHEPSG